MSNPSVDMQKIEKEINNLGLELTQKESVRKIVEEVTGKQFIPPMPKKFSKGDIIKFYPVAKNRYSAEAGSLALFCKYEYSNQLNRWVSSIIWLDEYSNGQMNGGYYDEEFMFLSHSKNEIFKSLQDFESKYL